MSGSCIEGQLKHHVTDKQLDKFINAIREDAWCQECALENTLPALAVLLKEIRESTPLPEWISKKLKERED